MILVTGATGTTGGATLRALVSTGAPVRALVRNPNKFAAPPGVEVAVGSFEDSASLDAALQGVDRAYLIGPFEAGMVQLETAFVEAAKRSGLGHLVRLSVFGADAPGVENLRLGKGHHTMEGVVRDSGIPHTFLRPNGFMQNYLGYAQLIAGGGVFYSALSPAARTSYVDAEDIGAMAARTLTEPGHEGKAYVLTGPEALNDDEIAAHMSSVLGREVKHVQVPIEAARQGMLASGFPEWNVDGLVELFSLYESGAGGYLSPDIEHVLGRPPRTFDDFLRDNRQAFAA